MGTRLTNQNCIHKEIKAYYFWGVSAFSLVQDAFFHLICYLKLELQYNFASCFIGV